jgi:cytidylate kinase
MLRSRDAIDSGRSFAPLKPAPDSVLIDTSYLTVSQAVDGVLKIIHDKTGIEIPCH